MCVYESDQRVSSAFVSFIWKVPHSAVIFDYIQLYSYCYVLFECLSCLLQPAEKKCKNIFILWYMCHFI